jgi:ribonuclease P protein component
VIDSGDGGSGLAKGLAKELAMERLTRRADFLAAAKGLRASFGAFVVQARRRAEDGPARIGFTVSRQVGNAVVRNRVRRRLREMVRLSAQDWLQRDQAGMHGGHDYVLIGRRAALAAPFGEMKRDLDAALRRIHDPERTDRAGAQGTGGGRERSLHQAGSRPTPRPEKPRNNPRDA